MRKVLFLALLVACASKPTLHGVIRWERHQAWRDYRAGLAKTWDATMRTLRNLNYPVRGNPRPGPDGNIEIADLWLRVDPRPPDSARLRVRVSTFDTREHRRRARQILEGVASLLEE